MFGKCNKEIFMLLHSFFFKRKSEFSVFKKNDIFVNVF